MSFAQDVLKGRVQARDEAARSRASEVSRANLKRYNAEQLRRKIEAERADLERREAALRREHDGLSRQLDAAVALDSETVAFAPPAPTVPEEKWWRLLGRPWTLVWRFVLIFGVISCVVLGLVMRRHPEMHWLYSAAMAACVPCSVCVFFAELARRMDLKWPWIALTYVLGGVASIVLTVSVNSCATFLPNDPVWAGVVEEPCKGAVLLFLFAALPKCKSVFAGLAFGAAVGAGFASIETFDYAYRFGWGGQPSTFVLILRGALAPLMHTGWTATLGGALWYVRHSDEPGAKFRRGWYAAGVFSLMVVSHCVWNSGNKFGYLPLIVWGLIFFYARKGTAEMRIQGKEWPR